MCNAIIVFACAQSDHTILLSINTHGAKLEDFELFTILRKPNLLVENRAMILEFNRKSRNSNEWAENDQS